MALARGGQVQLGIKLQTMIPKNPPFKHSMPLSPEREEKARQGAAFLLARKAMRLKERRDQEPARATQAADGETSQVEQRPEP